jgi:pimeloyl-ACP methyl ester carboxylesterase
VAVGELDKPGFHQSPGAWGRGSRGAEGAVIEAAGHLPSLERPEATARLVRAFLER